VKAQIDVIKDEITDLPTWYVMNGSIELILKILILVYLGFAGYYGYLAYDGYATNGTYDWTSISS